MSGACAGLALGAASLRVATCPPMPAPSEGRAIAALKRVQSLSGQQLDALIGAEVGTPMLGVLDTLAGSLLPNLDQEQRHRAVHLMVLAYLLRRDVETP